MNATSLVEHFNRADRFFNDVWRALAASDKATAKKASDVAAVAMLSLALEHCSAVATLFAAGWPASAFALLRPMHDAYLRGRWLAECADPAQLEKAVVRDKFPGASTMFEALCAVEPHRRESAQRFNDLSKVLSEGLHSFTHGGRAQLRNRVHEHGIQGSPPHDQVISAVKLAIGYGMLVVVALWEIYDDEQLGSAAVEIYQASGLAYPQPKE